MGNFIKIKHSCQYNNSSQIRSTLNGATVALLTFQTKKKKNLWKKPSSPDTSYRTHSRNQRITQPMTKFFPVPQMNITTNEKSLLLSISTKMVSLLLSAKFISHWKASDALPYVPSFFSLNSTSENETRRHVAFSTARRQMSLYTTTAGRPFWWIYEFYSE